MNSSDSAFRLRPKGADDMTRFDQTYSRMNRIFILGLLASLSLLPVHPAFAKGGGRGADDGGDRSGDVRRDDRGGDSGHGRGRGSDDGSGHSRGSSNLSGSGLRQGVGTVVRELPRGHREIVVNRRPFFFHEGRFFNRHRDGFIVVRAPIGAVITSLPLGFVSFVVGGTGYYLAGETYYRQIPEGYAVVDPPLTAATGTAVVQTELLNVRSGPDTSYDVLRVVNQGDQLYVIGSIPGWLNVELPDGVLGWVMAKFVQVLRDQPEG